MKIAFISNSDHKGGADLSAKKIFNLLDQKKIQKYFFVRFSISKNKKNN